jgi:outer membrane protein assembly factor BamA
LIEETERLLRGVRYVYDVKFRPVAVHDGVVDVEVETRDTWSLDPGFSASRSGGSTSSGIRVRDYNLFGTGVSVSLGHSRNVDRSSNEFQFSNDRAFGSWTSLAFSHAQNSDVRPFYALDTRWSAGVAIVRDDRIDSIYEGGVVASQYRHRQDRSEVFGGWSPGLVDGWVHRVSVGLSVRDDAFAIAPGLVAPAALPADAKLVGPFLRHEWIEDRYQKELNRNLIGRPEYFALGFNSRAELGWAGRRWGSTHNTWLYDATASRGFEPAPDQTLIVAARISGKRSDGESRQVQLGGQVQYYLPQNPRWLFYAAGAFDTLSHADPGEPLQLGGDNGLRGYPLRYQSGTHRALFTVEERFYTDLYVWRLFRIGGAAFFDAGRAWAGADGSRVDNGWLRNAGVGLRIVSARSAFSNVLHIDLAFPLDPTTGIKKVQFLVKTKTSF